MTARIITKTSCNSKTIKITRCKGGSQYQITWESTRQKPFHMKIPIPIGVQCKSLGLTQVWIGHTTPIWKFLKFVKYFIFTKYLQKAEKRKKNVKLIFQRLKFPQILISAENSIHLKSN